MHSVTCIFSFVSGLKEFIKFTTGCCAIPLRKITVKFTECDVIFASTCALELTLPIRSSKESLKQGIASVVLPKKGKPSIHFNWQSVLILHGKELMVSIQPIHAYI